jgi:hypothetical protein
MPRGPQPNGPLNVAKTDTRIGANPTGGPSASASADALGFDQGDPDPRRGKRVGSRAPGQAATDNDGVNLVGPTLGWIGWDS